MAKIGRPKKNPTKEHCQLVIDMMRDGASKTEVCAEIDICYETFQRWREEEKEFSDAVKRGEQLSKAWWEKQGRVNLENNKFNYTGWYMNMKNRHGWRDKHEVADVGEFKESDEFL